MPELLQEDVETFLNQKDTFTKKYLFKVFSVWKSVTRKGNYSHEMHTGKEILLSKLRKDWVTTFANPFHFQHALFRQCAASIYCNLYISLAALHIQRRLKIDKDEKYTKYAKYTWLCSLSMDKTTRCFDMHTLAFTGRWFLCIFLLYIPCALPHTAMRWLFMKLANQNT